MINGLDHIGIIVEDLDAAVDTYTKVFGFSLAGKEEAKEQGMVIATLRQGDLNIELLKSTSDEGVLANFLKKRGPGVHHLAFSVSDIGSSLKSAGGAGLRLIDHEPRSGSGNTLIAFIHPKDTHGVLIELCERQATS